MDTNYTLSAKNSGKWRRYGKLATNKYGNLQASFKVTPEFLSFVQENANGWLNFSAFEDKPKEESIPYE